MALTDLLELKKLKQTNAALKARNARDLKDQLAKKEEIARKEKEITRKEGVIAKLEEEIEEVKAMEKQFLCEEMSKHDPSNRGYATVKSALEEDRGAEDVKSPEPNEDPLACLEDDEPGVPLHFVFVAKDDAQGRAHPVLVSEEDRTAEDGMSPKSNEDPLACLEDDKAAVPLHFVFVAEDDTQGRAHPVLVSSILSSS